MHGKEAQRSAGGGRDAAQVFEKIKERYAAADVPSAGSAEERARALEKVLSDYNSLVADAGMASRLGLFLIEQHEKDTRAVEDLQRQLREKTEECSQAQAVSSSLQETVDSLKGKASTGGEDAARVAQLESQLAVAKKQLARMRKEQSSTWKATDSQMSQLMVENSFLQSTVKSLEARLSQKPSGGLHEGHDQSHEQQQQQQAASPQNKEAGPKSPRAGLNPLLPRVRGRTASSVTGALPLAGKVASGTGTRYAGFTARRNFMRHEEDRILVEECIDWMRGLAVLPPANAADADGSEEGRKAQLASALRALQTGVPLCDLLVSVADKDMAHIKPRIHRNATGGSYFAHDNVQLFLEGCARLGVPDHRIFQSSDLLGRPLRLGPVALCILSLARVSWQLYGVAPPDIVKMEIEIDKLRAERPPATVLAEAKARAMSSAAPVSPSSSSASAQKITTRRASAASIAGSVDKGGSSTGYIAVKDDPVDVKVSEVVSLFPEMPPPQRLARGEYQFGPHLVYVRELRDTALVRHRDQWTTLDAFVLQHAQDVVTERASVHETSEGKGEASQSKESGSAVAATGESTEESGTGGAMVRYSPGALTHVRQGALVAQGRPQQPQQQQGDVKLLTHRPRREYGYDADAYREFFHLTTIAVKLNHNLKDEQISFIDANQLFKKAVEEEVPFHQFYQWIDKEITKAYLESLVLSSHRRLQSGGDIRAVRRNSTGAFAHRPQAHTRAAVPEEDPGILEQIGEAVSGAADAVADTVRGWFGGSSEEQ